MIVRGKLLLALVIGSSSASEDIIDRIETANVVVPKGKDNHRNLYGEGDVDITKYKNLVDKYKDHPVSGGGYGGGTAKEPDSGGGGYGYHDFKFKRATGDHKKTKESPDDGPKHRPHRGSDRWKRPRHPKAHKDKAKEIHWVGGSTSSGWSGDSWPTHYPTESPSGWSGDSHDTSKEDKDLIWSGDSWSDPTLSPSLHPTLSPNWGGDSHDTTVWSGDSWQSPSWKGDSHDTTVWSGDSWSDPTQSPSWGGDSHHDDSWSGSSSYDDKCLAYEREVCCSQDDDKDYVDQKKICEELGCNIKKCHKTRFASSTKWSSDSWSSDSWSDPTQSPSSWSGDSHDTTVWSGDDHELRLDDWAATTTEWSGDSHDKCQSHEREICCSQHDDVKEWEQKEVCSKLGCNLKKCSKTRFASLTTEWSNSWDANTKDGWSADKWTDKPTKKPTRRPTWRPSRKPSKRPTKRPSWRPSKKPTPHPTEWGGSSSHHSEDWRSDGWVNPSPGKCSDADKKACCNQDRDKWTWQERFDLCEHKLDCNMKKVCSKWDDYDFTHDDGRYNEDSHDWPCDDEFEKDETEECEEIVTYGECVEHCKITTKRKCGEHVLDSTVSDVIVKDCVSFNKKKWMKDNGDDGDYDAGVYLPSDHDTSY